MRKIITGGITAAVAVSIAIAGGAFAGNPDSNGAQRSGLSPRSGDPMSGQCIAGNGAGTNGFTIFNAPGKPGATIKFNGEVSLKRGAPDTLYDVMLSKDGGSCMLAGMIMTNGQGNGNSHLAQPGSGAGTYYVVLQTGGNEAFATGPVTVK